MADDGSRDGRSGEKRGPGGSTDWGSMSIGEILRIISTMNESSAQGDATAVLTAIASVEAVARELLTGFSADGVLMGQAAQAAVDAAQRLGSQMSTSVAEARTGASALTQAAGILGVAHGQDSVLRQYQQQIQDHPEDAPVVRATVHHLMTGAYGGPMESAAARLPAPKSLDAADTFGGVGVGGGGEGGSGGGSTPTSSRAQSAAITDIDGLSPVGRSAGPDSGGPGLDDAPTGTPNSAATATAAQGAGGRGLSGLTGGDDEPAGLIRGGLGSPSALPGSVARTSGRGAGAVDATASEPGGVERQESFLPTGFAPISPILGPPVAGGPGAGTSAGVAPASPAGGARPAPGPGPGPGMTGSRSRDIRHRSAPYLHDGENGREIVGDLPLVGPPVIGDWSPHAMPPTFDDSGFGAVELPVSDHEPVLGALLPPEQCDPPGEDGTAAAKSTVTEEDSSPTRNK